MSILISDWLHTSNDLLRRLMAKHARPVPCYQSITQSAEDVQNVKNSPAFNKAIVLARVWTDKPLEDHS